MRVALVHNIIAPYRLEFFKHLSVENGVDLRVFFQSISETNREWDEERLLQRIDFPYEILKGIQISFGTSTIHFNPSLWTRLRKFKPEVIISASLSVATALCSLYAQVFGSSLVIWWPGTLETEKGISAFKRVWRRILIPRATSFVTYSQAASEYLKYMGVDEDQIFIAGNVTFDAREFHEQVEQAKDTTHQLLDSLDLPGRRILLSVGQFIPRKNHFTVLEVFQRLTEELDDLALVIVGEGPLREQFISRIDASDFTNVRVPGHVEPDELVRYYASADVFLHLTIQDHWSQVVGEAMSAELPLIVSNKDHASEMIQTGKSGFIVEPLDVDGVTRICRKLLIDPSFASEIGREALYAVTKMDINRSLQAFTECIRQSVGS